MDAITANGLKALLESPVGELLEFLQLYNVPIGDQGAEVVATSASLALRRLMMECSGMTDSGFRALAESPGLRKLRMLDASGGMLTSKSLELLADPNLLPSLTDLIVSEHVITPELRDNLAMLRPELTLSTESGGSCSLVMERAAQQELTPFETTLAREYGIVMTTDRMEGRSRSQEARDQERAELIVERMREKVVLWNETEKLLDAVQKAKKELHEQTDRHDLREIQLDAREKVIADREEALRIREKKAKSIATP